jgi:hypothetical protein
MKHQPEERIALAALCHRVSLILYHPLSYDTKGLMEKSGFKCPAKDRFWFARSSEVFDEV